MQHDVRFEIQAQSSGRGDRSSAGARSEWRFHACVDPDQTASRFWDCALGCDVQSDNPARRVFAFYGDEAPGRGTEIWFSGYEAFALLVGLRVLNYGWPQATAVRVMRGVRQKLEREHRRILEQNPATLFDQGQVSRRARPGMLAIGNTDPCFLAIVTRAGANRRSSSASPYSVEVCRGHNELVAS